MNCESVLKVLSGMAPHINAVSDGVVSVAIKTTDPHKKPITGTFVAIEFYPQGKQKGGAMGDFKVRDSDGKLHEIRWEDISHLTMTSVWHPCASL